MPEIRGFVQGVGLVLIAHGLKSVRGLVFIPLLTRALSQSDYGIWTQLEITTWVLLAVSLIGMNNTLTRFIAGEANKDQIRDDVWSTISLVVILSLVTTLALWILAQPLAMTFFGGAAVSKIIQRGALLIVTHSLIEISASVFQARRQTVSYSIFRLSHSLTDIVVVIIVVWQGWGVLEFVTILVGGRFINGLCGLLGIMKLIPPVWPRFYHLREILVFGAPLAFFLSFYLLINEGDRYVISFFHGPDAVAIYSVGYVVGTIPYILWYGPLWVLFYPTLVRYWEHAPRRETERFVAYCIKYSLIVTLPAIFGLSILAQPIIALMATEAYTSGGMVVPLAACGMVWYGLSMISNYVLLAAKRSGVVAITYGVSVVVNIGLNVALVPGWGIWGAGLATLITYGVMLLVMTGLARTYLHLQWQPVLIAKLLVASGLMAVILLWFLPHTPAGLLLTIPIGAMLYGVFLLILRAVTLTEIKQLISLFRPQLEKRSKATRSDKINIPG